MNFGGNAAFEQADMRAEQEREAGIAAASLSLRSVGTSQCEDCPNDIPRERRLALPSATRCIRCQTKHEQKQRYR
ncbi:MULTISPECIES: TraR/DksA C4-type zinc finger protein [Agrobacterium]|uniref:Transcriptional regulator, TraR/DksA family n=2 Tax=Agrobacterium TaxID=357 RepID=A0A9W5AZG6_9HYPH|nr:MULTISPECIES: TraR/DksA C4-type zinc finger protein [Agrobacterium]RRN67628.1 TraR/DksA family transcriptional regulator [Agrobacterium deltaense]HAU74834.1 molecular chaperone DnaK [Agrobacterium sp.]OJH50820.1 molecular chaperone DnaK [Agrobacterium pusense]OJH59895.1 molecular chaperone DnaK [Agrobacterium pusense]CUW88137.1 Transcriptional regulator, TraR/DksA family [Agrobacterium genomosp. 2 str. CFBP 5494]